MVDDFPHRFLCFPWASRITPGFNSSWRASWLAAVNAVNGGRSHGRGRNPSWRWQILGKIHQGYSDSSRVMLRDSRSHLGLWYSRYIEEVSGCWMLLGVIDQQSGTDSNWASSHLAKQLCGNFCVSIPADF